MYMKKRMFLMSFLLVCFLMGNSQELTNKMCFVYNGKVKSIKTIKPKEQNGFITEFLESGKVKTVIQNDKTIELEWLNEEEVKCQLINNGNVLETEYIYVNEFSESYYDYEVGVMNYKVWFRGNGSISHMQISANGYTMEHRYFYNNETDLLPFKMVVQMGEQSQVTYITIDKFDSKGNAIKITQTINEQDFVIERGIEYYD